MHLVRHVQCLKSSSVLTKSVISRKVFIKDHNIKFHRDFTSGKHTDSSSITDGRTEEKMKLIGVFYERKNI